MKRLLVQIYLRPEGLRLVDGYGTENARLAVVKLLCKTNCGHLQMRWFAFSQPAGSKLSDGWPTMEGAWTAGEETLRLLAGVSGRDRSGKAATFSGPAKWRMGKPIPPLPIGSLPY